MGDYMKEQIEYSNNKQYGSYSITPIQTIWNKPDAELNFNIYIKHVEDSIRIINSTTNPLTFFYRFDFAVKRYISLCSMSQYVKSSKRDFVKEINNLIAFKQQYIHNLIIRVNENANLKIASLKTEKGKINHAEKIKDSFSPYLDEMSRENIIFLNNVIDSLKSGNNKLIVPEVKNINQSSPVTQISNNTINQEAKNKKSGCSCSTIIVVFIVLLLIGRCGKKSNSNESSEADIIPVTTQSTEIRSQETETTEPVTTETTTEAKTESETTTTTTTTTTKAPELSEMEILTLKNHPKFYGSNETAGTVWAEYIGKDSVMIKNAIGHHYTYNDAILVLDCYKSGGAFRPTDSNIRGISIRFNNFKKDKDISFEKGIELAKEYFPDNIISKHYTLNASFYQIADNGAKEYTIEYKLNDGEDKENYSDFVSVVLYTDENGMMRMLDINCNRNGQSRFENEKIEWNYDLLSE
ncbi:MAG: hypothetical protein K2J32_11780 [Ruminococcus sp.]|nr:hypothetical protein [Ruminococcus sp.]